MNTPCLASRVPNLELDDLIIHRPGGRHLSAPSCNLQSLCFPWPGADLEVHTNRRFELLVVDVISKAKENVGLAHARVSNDQQLEEEVLAGTPSARKKVH